jgi:Tfp pilus assembly protein FimT
MRTTRPGHEHLSSRRGAGAFTLIELILLMALLTVLAAIVTPTLASFFRGRTQEAEAQRLLALTHYGQSRAVSEGIPALLWVNPQNGTYGLMLETGYVDNDPKAQDFVVDKDLRINIAQGSHMTGPTKGKLPGIHFSPDGTTSAASLAGISIEGRDKPPLWIAQSGNGVSYEIQDQYTFNRARQ